MDYDICKECGDCRNASFDYCFNGKGIVFVSNGRGDDVMVQTLLRQYAGKNGRFRKAVFRHYHLVDRYACNCRFCPEQTVYELNSPNGLVDALLALYDDIRRESRDLSGRFALAAGVLVLAAFAVLFWLTFIK